MPNWVYNDVTISADDPAVLAQLVEAVKGFDGNQDVPFNFQSILPRPADQDDNWYDWNCANWATKWPAGEISMETYDNGDVQFHFQTAWSPPTPVIAKLSALFPTVSISFDYEEEQGWGGETFWVNGEMVENREWDIPSTHAEYVERGRACDCEDSPQNPYFPDCFYEQVRDLVREHRLCLTDAELALVQSLSPSWRGHRDDLVATARGIHATGAAPSA